ncbi:MAG: hypothetical protein HY866_10110 [Chloroflexi bacterium]|nr:hypothetical protein [Chloroflexota bacterium]
MGIKLDWQVESEQSQVKATEDPDARRRRQIARHQMLAVIGALACVLAGIGGLIAWRLWSVDSRLRQDLLDTVEVEITALRVGDLANFMAVQRSASDSFLLEQSRHFEEYQQLKQARRIELTGEVLSTEIDEPRGRVVVQEIIDGVPYQVVWFYWHYEDAGSNDQPGWRHVPDDLTFWGEEREIKALPVTIHYQALDEKLAQALAPRLQDWWTRGCQLITCRQTLPPLKVEIVADRQKLLGWAADDAWTLRISSPLVGRSRADLPLAPELESDIAHQIADRLVAYAAGDLGLLPYTDAAWLQSEIGRWLADSFLGVNNNFVQSLVAGYGPGVPNTLLAAVQGGALLDGALLAVTGVPAAMLSPDQLNTLVWRDFFQWRLQQEWSLLAQGDSAAFLSLYDQESVSALNEATLRLGDATYTAAAVPQVGAVTINRDDQGQTYAYASATQSQGGVSVSELTIIWRLAGSTWKRGN